MKPYTDSWALFSKQLGELYDFSLLSAYAIPSLKKHLNDVQGNTPIKTMIVPDFYRFDESNKNRLNNFIKDYEEHLSSYFLITAFSFFEAYVKGVILELIDYHGGNVGWMNNTNQKFKNIEMEMIKNGSIKHVRSLMEPFRKDKKGKYLDKQKILKNYNYVFPSQKMSIYGISQLISKIKDLGAKQIPIFLERVFSLNLSKKRRFHNIREKRNNIAHGKKLKLSLRESRAMAKSLREMSVEIDKFFLRNYFILEFIK